MDSHETASSADGVSLSAAQLWTVAILGFVVGDVATTSLGLGLAGVSEANPVAAGIFDRSLSATVVVKLGFVGGCYLLWRSIPLPQRAGIPLALAVVGVLVTARNLQVILRPPCRRGPA